MVTDGPLESVFIVLGKLHRPRLIRYLPKGEEPASNLPKGQRSSGTRKSTENLSLFARPKGFFP